MSRLDSSTVVPLSVVGGILVAIASLVGGAIKDALAEQNMTMKAQSELLAAQSQEIAKLSHRIDLMEVGMSARMKAVDEVVTRREMKAWCRELKASNIGKLEVPHFEE